MSESRILKVLVLFIFIFFLQKTILAQDSVSDEPSYQPDTEKERSISLKEDVIVSQGVESYLEEIEDVQWLWGEIIEVSATDKTIMVRFLDYEADAEKDAVFSLNEESKFENVASINDVKPRDSAGVDYCVDESGKFIIKSISIEKLDIP